MCSRLPSLTAANARFPESPPAPYAAATVQRTGQKDAIDPSFKIAGPLNQKTGKVKANTAAASTCSYSRGMSGVNAEPAIDLLLTFTKRLPNSVT
jgi:hypothetical protein